MVSMRYLAGESIVLRLYVGQVGCQLGTMDASGGATCLCETLDDSARVDDCNPVQCWQTAKLHAIYQGLLS